MPFRFSFRSHICSRVIVLTMILATLPLASSGATLPRSKSEPSHLESLLLDVSALPTGWSTTTGATQVTTGSSSGVNEPACVKTPASNNKVTVAAEVFAGPASSHNAFVEAISQGDAKSGERTVREFWHTAVQLQEIRRDL